MVLVGNKVKIKDRKIKTRQINFHRKRNIQYYDKSVKSNYQFEKPFLFLLKRLVNDVNLELIRATVPRPGEIEMTADAIEELEREQRPTDEMAINSVLPDEYDDEFR